MAGPALDLKVEAPPPRPESEVEPAVVRRRIDEVTRRRASRGIPSYRTASVTDLVKGEEVRLSGRGRGRDWGSAVHQALEAAGRGAPLRESVAGPHDDRGQRLVLPEGALRGDDLGGFGAARQERGLVVGGDLAEPAGVRAEDAADDQPDGDQQEGDERTGASGGGGHGAPESGRRCLDE